MEEPVRSVENDGIAQSSEGKAPPFVANNQHVQKSSSVLCDGEAGPAESSASCPLVSETPFFSLEPTCFQKPGPIPRVGGIVHHMRAKPIRLAPTEISHRSDGRNSKRIDPRFYSFGGPEGNAASS